MPSKETVKKAEYYLTHPWALFSAVVGLVLSAPDVLAGAVSGVGTLLLSWAPALGQLYGLGGILLQIGGMVPGVPVRLIQIGFVAVAVLYAAVYLYRLSR